MFFLCLKFLLLIRYVCVTVRSCTFCIIISIHFVVQQLLLFLGWFSSFRLYSIYWSYCCTSYLLYDVKSTFKLKIMNPKLFLMKLILKNFFIIVVFFIAWINSDFCKFDTLTISTFFRWLIILIMLTMQTLGVYLYVLIFCYIFF